MLRVETAHLGMTSISGLNTDRVASEFCQPYSRDAGVLRLGFVRFLFIAYFIGYPISGNRLLVTYGFRFRECCEC